MWSSSSLSDQPVHPILKAAEPWSLTSLRVKPIKIGANVVSHGRYVTFQMADVAVPRQMLQDILPRIAWLRAPLALACVALARMRRAGRRTTYNFRCSRLPSRSIRKAALIDPGIRGYGFEPLAACPVDEFFPRVN